MGTNRIFHLKWTNKEDYQIWKEAFNTSISNSKAKEEQIIFKPRKSITNQWKTQIITEEELIKKSRTGDIIIANKKNAINLNIINLDKLNITQKDNCAVNVDKIALLLKNDR